MEGCLGVVTKGADVEEEEVKRMGEALSFLFMILILSGLVEAAVICILGSVFLFLVPGLKIVSFFVLTGGILALILGWMMFKAIRRKI